MTVGLAVAIAVLIITAAAVASGAVTYKFVMRNRRRYATQWVAIRVAVAMFVAATVYVTFVFPFFRPFRLSIATVRLKGGACVVGPLIAADSDGVHLIDGETKQIATIPAGDVQSVSLGTAPFITHARIRAGRSSDPTMLLGKCDTSA